MLDIALLLKSEPDVYISLTCELGVRVPHSGKRLANGTYDVLNHAGLFLTSAWDEGFFLVLPHKGVKDRDFNRYEAIRGSRATSQQNLSHFAQCPSELADRLEEIPLAISFAAAWKLLQK